MSTRCSVKVAQGADGGRYVRSDREVIGIRPYFWAFSSMFQACTAVGGSIYFILP